MSTSDILALVFGVLYAASEYLGSNPKIKENAVYQVVSTILKQNWIVKLFKK